MENFLVICIYTLIAAALGYYFWRKFYFKRRCIKCKEKFSPNDVTITASELKWENKEKQTEKNTGGALSVTGTNYIEFVRYRVYFRIVKFQFKCSKCGNTKTIVKRVDLYDNRSRFSKSENELNAILYKKVEKTLGKKFLNGTQIKIANIDY